MKFMEINQTPLVTNSLEMKRYVRDYGAMVGNRSLNFGSSEYTYKDPLSITDTTLDKFDQVITELDFQ